MDKERIFLIMCDLDGSFDTKNKQDVVQFLATCKTIEELFCCKVKLSFITGTTADDLDYTLMKYISMSESLKDILSYHIVEDGICTQFNGNRKRICKSELYDKATGVDYVVHNTLFYSEQMVGCCYIGDTVADSPAFELLEIMNARYPLGATSIRLNSNVDNIYNNNKIYVSNRNLIGVNEGLNIMKNCILASERANTNIFQAKQEMKVM